VEECKAILMPEINLINLKHPEYQSSEANWEKWRLTYEADDDFIEEYMVKFSDREGDAEFIERKNISYVPAFAAAAVDEVGDSIFQRISDVTREGGSENYLEAVRGNNGGIDLTGTTMNSFVGRNILKELLAMRRVGVFIDMPTLNGETIADQKNIHPYIYMYKAENIINWRQNEKKETFTHLLLRDFVDDIDEDTGLLVGYLTRYKLLTVMGDLVRVQFFNETSQLIDEKFIELPEIPFVVFELKHSLLKNIANYQISLLNLASSDIAYILKSNFPFYVEQFDPRIDNLYGRPPAVEGEPAEAKSYEIEVGVTTGRRYPKGIERPEFIHPSSEPLKASMQKQEELKKDIRILVKLNVSNLTPKMASGESKSFDERSLEAGLSAIGLELEHGERNIAKYWQMYENPSQEQATIKYPEKYSLQSDADRRKEAKDLQESTKGHPSTTYKREVYKTTASMLVGPSVSKETLDKIRREIDAAEVIVSDSEELHRDIEIALISPETASRAKGYPKGEHDRAKEAHTDRIRRIAESQGQARGVTDLGGISNASRSEKVDNG
jgi:hypothetical protein